jgi:hypothetical protein
VSRALNLDGLGRENRQVWQRALVSVPIHVKDTAASVLASAHPANFRGLCGVLCKAGNFAKVKVVRAKLIRGKYEQPVVVVSVGHERKEPASSTEERLAEIASYRKRARVII